MKPTYQFYAFVLDVHYYKVPVMYLCLSLLLIFLTSSVLITESLYFDFYGLHLSYEDIIDLINEQERWQWLAYLTLPIVLIIQFFLVSCIIIGGLIVAGEKSEFSIVLKSVVVAEFFLLIPLLIKFVWFGFIYREYSLADLQFFASLSLGSLFDLSQQPKWIVPALQSINLFLLGYIFVISYSLSELLSRPLSKMLAIVVSSYGSAWLVLQVFVVFLLINLT